MRLVARQGEVTLIEQGMQANPTSSVLAELEVRAAVYKRWHDGEITEAERDLLLATYDTDILPTLTFIALDDDVLRQAHRVVARYRVRSLDALHVATAVVVDQRVRRHGSTLLFCTADRRQADAASGIFGATRVIVVPPWRGKHSAP